MLVLTDFFSIDELDNTPGYSRYWFIADDSVISIPRHVNGIIDFDGITYKPGKDYWYSGGALFTNLDLGEKEEKTSVGSIYPIDITGTTAGIKPNVISLFHAKRNARFIVIIGDNNGNYFIVGEPNNGLKFSYKRQSNTINFSYTGGYKLPAFFLSNYQGSTPSPGGGGGGEGGGVVTIKRTGGTTISTVTAPAEYTVADTVVRVRDSANNQLSIHNIKAADGNIDLPAPNATINIRNMATALIATIERRSGSNSDYEFPDTNYILRNGQDDIIYTGSLVSGVEADIVVPDTSFQLKDTAGANIGAPLNLPSGITNDIIAPDAVANIKNTNGTLLTSTNIKSGSADDVTVDNTPVIVKDSAGTAIGGASLPSGVVSDIVVDDATLTLNGAAWRTVKAEESANVALVDDLNNPIVAVSTTPGEIKVQVFQSDSSVVRRAARYANLILTGYSNSIIR